MRGTDHAASLELKGVEYVLNYILQVRDSIGSSDKKILQSEIPAIKKLRS
jgi:sialic acid synthase SpsE